MDTCICLTATIEPNTTGVLRSDAAARLSDYKGCIEFYLNQTSLPIYFLENSKYNLEGDPFFKNLEEEGRFTILRYDSHPDRTRGKGFQEFYMLDQFVAKDLQFPRFIKITGRYLVRNIASIIPAFDSPLNMDLHRKMKVAITGLFASNKDLYQSFFSGAYSKANDDEGVFIEHIIYEIVKSEIPRNLVSLLPQNPYFEGISASYGGSLQRNKYKMMVRGIERKVNSKLGINEFLIEY
jgi:hypothetical protein